MCGTDGARLARLDVSVDPLVSEESSQGRQRLDRAWMDGIPLRIPRPTVWKQVMIVPSTQPLAKVLTGWHGYWRIRKYHWTLERGGAGKIGGLSGGA
jgi:hypothetical protein